LPIFALDDALRFPPVHLAEGSGLLAMGGDLSPERLILAYKSGIFPWYDHPPILWWCPDPRFVLFPVDFKVSKNLKPLLKNNTFEFTINIAFSQVIDHCKEIFRPGQDGTWITEEVKAGYVKLHELGFGESMFSLVSNASRYAFAKYMDVLKSEDIRVIDCQIHSDYLESMGAEMIDGKEFDRLLERYCRG
jgi:leucyl/phenylalanyl-tRNA--protein transferase